MRLSEKTSNLAGGIVPVEIEHYCRASERVLKL